MKQTLFKPYIKLGIVATLLLGVGFSASTYATSGHRFNMGGNVYECTDPTADGYDVDQDKCYSWCFVENTQVTMADGSKKDIEDVQVGDWLKGSMGPNRVEYLIRKQNQGNIYGFNGGKKFVTDSHPFMTKKGWKSINPEATKLGHPGLEVGQLEVGDTLITEHGDVYISSIESEYAPQKVYTFGVNGTHDYYADGYLVHNKYPPSTPCPAGWFSIEDVVYDWGISSAGNSYNCYGRDLGAPVLIGSGGGASPIADVDIMNMIYWDKNQNNSYDSGTDRPLIMNTHAVSQSGDTGYPYFLTSPFYFAGGGFRYNNAVNLAVAGTYNYGISLGSITWTNLLSQGFYTNDQTTGTVTITGVISYITGVQVGVEYVCNGTGTQTVNFIEYSCPAGYSPAGSMCYTGTNVMGGTCLTNSDCTSPGTCVGASSPNSEFKYNDAQPWNASHPHWEDAPHSNPGGRCRDGDDAIGCVPNDPNQNPNWYGGGLLCGCDGFIPNTDSTPGTCSTSSSNWITASQTVVTDTATCSGTGCVPNWTCSSGYTLTGDTNNDGNPNCYKTTCTTTTGSTTGYYYPYDWNQPGPISVGCSATEDGGAMSCAASYWIVSCSIGTTATTDITVEYSFVNSGTPCGPVSVTIPNGSSVGSTNLSCGCAIAATPEGEVLVSVSPTSMDGRRFQPYFIYESSTGVDISSDIANCGCDGGAGSQCPASVGTGPTQLDGTYGRCYDYIGGINWDYNIYGYKQTTSIPGGQTVCSNDYEEATDTNNCSGCGTTTEAPVVCDLNDPLMAGVCYIPGGFGTVMHITNGMVGVNTDTPSYPLDVDGIIRAGGIYTLSDARLKDSISKIDNALEKIRQLNGYSFTWKKSGAPDLGLLAQEVEKVFSDAVKSDIDGKKAVQYNALIAPIIEAIHELNTQVDALYNEKYEAQAKRLEVLENSIK